MNLKGIDSGRDNSAETDLPFNVPYRGKDKRSDKQVPPILISLVIFGILKLLLLEALK